MHQMLEQRKFWIFWGIFIYFSLSSSAQELALLETSPRPNQVDVAPNSMITLVFNRTVSSDWLNEKTLTVIGEKSGAIGGTLSIQTDGQRVIFAPQKPFLPGDRVAVILAKQPSRPEALLKRGYIWEFYIKPGRGNRQFRSLQFQTGLALTSIAVADFNQDGRVDIAVTGRRGVTEWLKILYFRTGRWVNGDSLLLPHRVRPLYAADLNRDGIPDLVLMHRGRTRYSLPPRISTVFVNRGGLQLSQTIDLLYAQFGYAEPRGVAIHDYNNDGWLDMAVVLRNEDQRSGLVYLNDGNGRFPTQRPPVVSFSKEKAAESIFCADLNRTGFIDIGVGHSINPAKVEVHINNGNVDLKPSKGLDNLNADLELGAAADLSGDGNADIVMGDFAAGEILYSAFTGAQKDGEYLLPQYSQPPKRFAAVQYINSMELADMDGDGDLDIAATGSGKDQLQFLWNSAAEFQSSQVSIPSNPAKLAAGDVNRDGALDVVVADTTGLLILLINDIASYQPPARPILILPENRAFTANQQPVLRWQTPADANAGDSLQFRVTLQGTFDVRSYTSWDFPEAFSPSPTVLQGKGEVSFTLPIPLAEGTYRWFVEAFDGLFWSQPSEERRFSVDITSPRWIDVSFPDAVFNNRWIPLDNGAVRMRAVFNERNPKQIVVDQGPLGGPFVFAPLPGGESAAATLSFSVSGSLEGEYALNVTLIDSAGLEAQTTAVVGIDRSPPTGAKARVDAAVSAAKTFRVYWGGGSDGSGSGLAGEYSVQVRQDDGPWILWLEKTKKLDSLFTGVNGSRYDFEAAAFDRVGRRELFMNQAEASVSVRPFAFDQTPPPAPANLRASGANPSPWQRSNRFLITWTPPPDETGIHSAFLKFGTPPTGNNDYDRRASGLGPVEVEMQNDGRAPLFVWLSDSAGNADYRNRASVMLRRDASSPVIQSFTIDSPQPSGVAADQTPWFNLKAFGQMVLGVTYEEVFPERAVLSTDGLGDSLVNRGASLGSGSPRRSIFSVPTAGASTKSYLFRTSVTDSAGNRAERTLRLGLDGAPPSGSAASSPAVSATDTFTVRWSAASDGSGSGVVRYDLYVKPTGGNWQLWHSALTPGKRTFTGQDKQTYFFEAVAVDLVGLSEPLSSAGECSTRVDFASGDKDAPPPPLDLRANGANPSPWSKNPIFTISWRNPADATGIAKALWKIGPAPAANYDTTGSAAPTGSLQVRLTTADKQTLHLWLVDGAGNTDFRNAARVVLRYDPDAPRISSTRFVNPAFGRNWYNPLRETAVSFEVTYQESFPQLLSLSAPELGFSFSTSELTPGMNAKKEIQFSIYGKKDGAFLLQVALSDSAGNQSASVDTLRLDGTPPYGARAVTPPVSSSETFIAAWNPGQDDGVGVAGIYDVYVKRNDEAWRAWLTDFPGLSASFAGENGSRYAFEVIARDRLGNKEKQTFQAESITLINLSASDTTAPSAPIGLQAGGANPSPWQKSRVFTLNWTAPPDPSGIVRAFYKLDSPPISSDDTTGTLSGIPPVTVTASRQNGQMLYLWLKDGSGNVDYRNHASVLLRYDAAPPTIDSLVLDEPRPAADDMWYNPRVSPQRAVLKVYGSDSNLARIRLAPSALFSPAETGPNRTAPAAAFPLSFPNFDDAQIDLIVTLIDSAGNTVEAVKRMGLDGTPPRNTTAQSPDTVAPGEFVVFWNVNQIEENGSGLSGVYSVRVKINDQPWSVWNAQYRGTSFTFVGEEGKRYAFEVAAYDRAGNWEGFTGTPESITYVWKTHRDTTPPPAPQGVTVNGRTRCLWSTLPEFTVDWIQPADPSGISQVFYKFYAPPVRPDDYTGSAAGTPPLRIKAPGEGVIPIYLWLMDGVGNADYRQYAETVLRYDATMPLLSQAAFVDAVDGKWFHPDSANHALLTLRYTESRPDSLVLFFNKAEIPKIILTPLAGGQNVPLQIPIVLAELLEGCQMLYLALSDSAGNRTIDSLALCLDSTPPYGARAASPAHSASARFTVTWHEAPGNDDGSGLSGEYDLRMSVNQGPWFDVLTRAKTFSYIYVGTQGNTFSFEAAAWDRVGNREPFTGIAETETVVDTTFEDRTAPPAPIGLNVAGANPSRWQNSPDFIVEWQNPADPSGIAVAYWKLGAPPVTERDITDSLVLNDEKGRIIVRVRSEGIHPLHVWLKDGHGNASRAAADAILLRYDATPPILGRPQVLSESLLPNYVNQKKTPNVPIKLYFRELHPDSLLYWSEAFGFHRLRLSTVEDTLLFSLSAANVSDGAHRLYVALKDSAGNWSGKDSLILHLDSRPPVVNVLMPDTLAEESGSVTIRAVVTDNDTLTTVMLLYRRGGRRRFLEKQMVNTSTAIFEAEIPGSEVTARGVEWAIAAADGVNRTKYPSDLHAAGIRTRIAGNNQQGLTLPWPLPAGGEQNAYRMISLPLEPEKASPKDIFEDDFGSYDPHIWRLFFWEPLESFYVEYPRISALRPGAAYWLIIAKESMTFDTGPGISVSTVSPFVIVLKKGWNDIASPYAFAVDWRDIRWTSAIDTQKVQGPHAYIGRWQYPFENTVMQPWQGYAVYSELEDFSIVIPPLEAEPKLAKRNPFERSNIEWSMQIVARMDQAEDSANYLGFAKEATDKWDYGLDYIEAPAIGAYIRLYFPHRDWQLKAEQYTTDFRPPSRGSVWQFEVAAQEAGEATLLFRPVGLSERSLSLKLVDIDANTSMDIRADSLYKFCFSERELVRHFALYVGNDQFIEEHRHELPAPADSFELLQNHPNPFNHSTIISFQIHEDAEINLAIYNLLAQKVKQLYDGPVQKGYHQFSWDARDDLGREIGTGIYILRLETQNFTSTRKLVFIR